MKKQISFLVMFLAIFATVSNSFGQLVPRKVTCLTSDALHPVAGIPYTYQIEIPANPAGGPSWTSGSFRYTWYVTQNTEFITLNGGVPTLTADADREKVSGLLLKEVDGNYNNSNSTSNSTTLTWKSFYYDPAKPVFVVINVVGNNGLCDPSNLKVFKIEPKNAFTLDIDNLTEAGNVHTPPVLNTSGLLTSGDYGDLYEQCVSPIQSAKYDMTKKEMVYDFGKNIMMYEVVAANWYTSWRPSFTLTGVDPLETVTVEYSKDKTFATGITMSPSATHSASTTNILTFTTTTSVTTTVANGFVDDKGERIYVRVTLDHSDGTNPSYQGLVDEKIDLAVDGHTNLGNTATEIGDVNITAGSGTGEECPWVDGYKNDIAHQVIKGRPTINSTTVGVSPNPNPGLFLEVKP